MKTCDHGNVIDPPEKNCLLCMATSSPLMRLPVEPLPNGWHMNSKLLAEEGRFVLLDRAGTAMAEFTSEHNAALVLAIIYRAIAAAN